MNKPSSKLPVTLPLSVLALGAAELQADPQGFENDLAILRGRVDGLEARVGELEATQFSTTTKLKGQALFILGAGSDINSAESAGFTQRLNLDTSFTGKDLLATRLRVGAGHTGNASEELSSYWGRSSDFYNLNAELYYRFPIEGLGEGYVSAGAGYHYFSDEIPTRQDGDNDIYDFDASFGAFLTINDKLKVSTKNQLSHGGIGGFGRTLRQGVLDRDLTTFFSENHINYDLSDRYSLSLGLRYKYFNESGADSLDSDDLTFIQEVSYNGGDKQPTYYFNYVFGERDYKYRPMTLDSSFFQVNAGLRGSCPCGASYDFSIGHEERDYDYNYFGRKSNTRFEASVFGSPPEILGYPTEGVTLAFLAGYGVHNVFANYGGMNMVDPLGWLVKFQVQKSFDDRGDLGIAFEYSDLEGRLSSGSNTNFERFSTEVYYNYPINDKIILTPGIIFTSVEGNSQDDDFVVGYVRTTFSF